MSGPPGPVDSKLMKAPNLPADLHSKDTMIAPDADLRGSS